MSEDRFTCIRCGGHDFIEHDAGPDSYDDDITYTNEECKACGATYHGWFCEWYDSDTDAAYAHESHADGFIGDEVE